MGKVLMSGIVPKLTVPVGINSVLNDNDWETIHKVSDAGLAANYWAIGDTKTITINGKVGIATFSNLEIDVFIIGIDHNPDIEGSNRIHFQIGKIDGTFVGLVDRVITSSTIMYDETSGAFTMTAKSTTTANSGGWNSCQMRKTVLGSDSTPTNPTANTLLAALPSDLRAVMKSVTKYTDNTGKGLGSAKYVTSTTDYLWILAEFEFFGTRKYANNAEQNYQKQYDYYKAGNSLIHYTHNDITNTEVGACRSAYYSSKTNFCTVGINGSAASDLSYMVLAIAPAFCV